LETIEAHAPSAKSPSSSVCFPISIDDHMPRNAALHSQVRSPLESQLPLPRVPISIDDHFPLSATIHARVSLGAPDATIHARVPISIDDHLQSEDSRQTRRPNPNEVEIPTPIVQVLKASLQKVGVEQFESDYVIENVKKCLDLVTGNTLTTDPATRASQWNDSGTTNTSHDNSGAKAMMICNIPCRVSHADLVEAIASMGFGGTFSHVKLPRMFGQSSINLGYGFVHFLHRTDAERFAFAFEGFRFGQRGSTKACTVKVADCQDDNQSHRRMCRNLRQAQHKVS
jgi:hypothetical protein